VTSAAGQCPLQRLDGVAAEALGDIGLEGDVEAVIGAGIDMQLGRHAGGQQPLGIVDILVEEDVERADADEGRRQAGQAFRPRRRGIG